MDRLGSRCRFVGGPDHRTVDRLTRSKKEAAIIWIAAFVQGRWRIHYRSLERLRTTGSTPMFLFPVYKRAVKSVGRCGLSNSLARADV